MFLFSHNYGLEFHIFLFYKLEAIAFNMVSITFIFIEMRNTDLTIYIYKHEVLHVEESLK